MHIPIRPDPTNNFPTNMDDLIQELDAAVETHMGWTRRVMRCAVLHTSPGEDVLSPAAHTLCQFGRWFMSRKADFENLDAAKTQRIFVAHQLMHDAIRAICNKILTGQPGNESDLETFEQTQTELTRLLAGFKNQILAITSQHDQLTGLPLRSGIEQEYRKLQNMRLRHKLLLYVGMIDVDNFKNINDTYGHPVGDLALCHTADTLKRNLRDNDSLFRFGGEEFLLLMLAGTPEESDAASMRLLNAMRKSPVSISHGKSFPLTFTMGICDAKDDEPLSDAITRADQALYEGKRAGRDRYIFAHA